MQKPTCPVCRQPLPAPAEAGLPVPACPRCRCRARLPNRVLQMALLGGLLVATTGAAGVFALSDCPCSPLRMFRHEQRTQEVEKLQPEPPAPPPPPEGGGAKLLPPTPSDR